MKVYFGMNPMNLIKILPLLLFLAVACSPTETAEPDAPSPAVATQSGPIRIIRPIGLEKWEIGSSETVEFTINALVVGTSPRIELWKPEAAEASWISEAFYEDENTVRRTVEIVVPDIPTGAYRVRIASTFNTTLFAETTRAIIVEN